MLGIKFAFTACAYMSPNGRASVYSTESCWFKSSHYPKGIAQRLNAIGLSVIFGLHEPVWSGICLEHKLTGFDSRMYPKGFAKRLHSISCGGPLSKPRATSRYTSTVLGYMTSSGFGQNRGSYPRSSTIS